MRKIQLTVLILLAAALSTLLAALLSALTGLLCLLTRILLLAALLSALAGLLWLLTRILLLTALLTTLILLVHRVLLFGFRRMFNASSVLHGSIDCRRANTLRGNRDRAVPLFLHLRQFMSLRNEITGKAVLGRDESTRPFWPLLRSLVGDNCRTGHVCWHADEVDRSVASKR